VQLRQLRLENLRNISALDLELGPGLSLFVGPNGAGKTSILEGAYLLSHAQSFRTGLADSLIRRSADQLVMSAMLERNSGPIRIGLARSRSGWQAKVNGSAAPSLGSMLREYALVCFEPGSHALISGASVERRRFLDWGVFHVEPDFLARARQYRRALRQRNAALKQAAADSELAAWDDELAQAALPLAQMRRDYFTRYALELTAVLRVVLPELGEAEATFAAGWPADTPLAQALSQVRVRDRARGHTTLGPHRADWSVRFALAPQREHLSRGQEKLCALACMLAQARLYATMRGEWPVIALDDLASELDEQHQRLIVEMLCEGSAQVLISGIDVPACLRRVDMPLRVFHVEHGELRGLL
jgi:DNA replication and repair protein RecF